LVAEVQAGKVKELSATLTGTLPLGHFGLPHGEGLTLESPALGVRPGDGLGYLSGSVQFKGVQCGAALVLGAGKSALWLQARRLDLGKLLQLERVLGRVPKLEAVLVLGQAAAASTAVADLPAPVQAMVAEVAGAATSKLAVATGVTLFTKLNAKDLGFDKVSIPGPLLLTGALDLETRQFELDAALGAMPEIPDRPRGVVFESPQFMFGVKKTDLGPELRVGLRLAMKVHAGAQELEVDTRVTADSQGTLSFLGELATDWVEPLGLKGVTLKAPLAVTVAASAEGSADLGFQAGARIGDQEFNPVALCLNIQAAAPVPVTRKLGIHFKASTLAVGTELALVQSLLKSAVEGPLKKGIPNARFRAALAKVDTAGDKVVRSAEKLPLPALENAELYLATPDIKCELPAFTGMGAQLSGELVLQKNKLGQFDSKVSLEEGLTIAGKVHPFKLLGLVELRDATLDLGAPMPRAGAAAAHFFFDGQVSLLQFEGKVHVVVDKQQVSFDLATELADLGALELWAKSVGGGLEGSDFQLGLRAEASAKARAALFKRLSVALQAVAAETRAAAAKEQAGYEKAMAAASRDYDQLDRTVGAEVRSAEAKVAGAQHDLDHATQQVEEAKKRCQKKGLGLLCEFTDAAKEGVKVAERSLGVAKGSLEALRKSEQFGNLAAKKASLETLKAEHFVASRSLAAAEDLDKVAAKAATGASHDLLGIEKLELEGSVRKASGTLSVTFKAGKGTVTERFEVDLKQKLGLVLGPVAHRIGDELARLH
jgi:hypothetical protein